MDFKLSKFLMNIGFVVGIFIMLTGIGIGNEKQIGIFMVVGSVVFFTSLIQAFVFYRCPHCGKSLMDVRGGIPEYCHNCGISLKDK